MVLGNHDYMGNHQAQIDYHYDTTQNKDGLWHMPSQSYNFSEVVHLDNSDFQIDIFALDTNGCQNHVVRKLPHIVGELHSHISHLRNKLTASTADWKIVFGHHPMYTQGMWHGETAERLRTEPTSIMNVNSAGESYTPTFNSAATSKPRFGLENTISSGGAQVYFCAHEHVFQVWLTNIQFVVSYICRLYLY